MILKIVMKNLLDRVYAMLRNRLYHTFSVYATLFLQYCALRHISFNLANVVLEVSLSTR